MKFVQWILVNLIYLLYVLPDIQATTREYPQLREFSDVILKISTAHVPSDNLGLGKKLGTLQPELDENIPFPCSVSNGRSDTRPTNVHTLKPGDIDVIGAFGDSLTAGNGLIGTSLSHLVIENRGVVFSIGGQKTWRKYTTLPNILKLFNPNLIGYALGNSSLLENYTESSQLNLAKGGATSILMPLMAIDMVSKIKEDSRINIQTDWKMISLFIGGNDFCGVMCSHENPNDIIENHRNNMLQTLRILRDNLPRTIVNLLVGPHLKTIREATKQNRPPTCYFTNRLFCKCLFDPNFSDKQDQFDEIMSKWQEMEAEIANAEEFDRDDFTVVLQTFSKEFEVPKNEEGLSDYSFFAIDCFHLSQNQHGIAATSLWNNLLEPVGRKSTGPFPIFEFLCPTPDQPFIYTRRNSIN